MHLFLVHLLSVHLLLVSRWQFPRVEIAEPAAAQPWPPETCRRQALFVRSSTCILARDLIGATPQL